MSNKNFMGVWVGMAVALFLMGQIGCSQSDKSAALDEPPSIGSPVPGPEVILPQPEPETELPDVDADSDGIFDADDNCMDTANADQKDSDSDGAGDACDADDDNDGINDAKDNCPIVANADQKDINENSIGDLCDPEFDLDKDEIVDELDNCVKVANQDQKDSDADKIGDACDGDIDGDGVANGSDNCLYVYNPDQVDENSSEGGDVCDAEIDGIVTSVTRFPIVGGNTLGAPEDARMLTPYAIALVDSIKKIIFATDGWTHKLKKGYINDNDGTVSEFKELSDLYIPYIKGMVTAPNQKSVIALQDLYIGFNRIIQIQLNATGDVASVVYPLKYSDGSEIKFDGSRLDWELNPVFSPDSRYLYYPKYKIATPSMPAHGEVDCVKFADDGNGQAGLSVESSGQTSLFTNESIGFITALGFVSMQVGETIENRLYIVNNVSNKILMAKVDGCSIVPGTGLTVVADFGAIPEMPLYSMVVSKDGARLYFVWYGYVTRGSKAEFVGFIELDPSTGLAKGDYTLIAGSKDEAGMADGAPLQSRMYGAKEMVLDEKRNRIYLAEYDNNTIKLIQLADDGKSATHTKYLIGINSKNSKKVDVDSTFRFGQGLAASSFDENGVQFVAASSCYSNTISLFRRDKTGNVLDWKMLAGLPYRPGYTESEWPAQFDCPAGMAFAKAKSSTGEFCLYTLDFYNHAIRGFRLKKDGNISKSNGGMVPVLKAINISQPVHVAISDDSKFLYFTNHVSGGGIHYIKVNPENCRSVSGATSIDQTKISGINPGGVAYLKNESTGKSYIYYSHSNGSVAQKVERIEIDPATGGPKTGAVVEFIAGSAEGKSGGSPQAAKFSGLFGLSFSQDKKKIYVVESDQNRQFSIIELDDETTPENETYVFSGVAGSKNNPFSAKDGYRNAASFTGIWPVLTLPIGETGEAVWVRDYRSNELMEIR